MHYASTNGHLEIIRFLIEKDAYVDVESPNSTTPLMLASRAGHIQVVKYLLDNEADLAAKNQLELTAIDFANMGNQKEIVEGLKSRWKKMYQSEYVLKPWP
jgi:ankyrin repeat protein